MVILILIIYILIGVCIAIGFSAYEYKCYKNSNIKNKNWDDYYWDRDLNGWFIIVISAWPLVSIITICYVLLQIPRIVVKKYYKIND